MTKRKKDLSVIDHFLAFAKDLGLTYAQLQIIETEQKGKKALDEWRRKYGIKKIK